MPEYAGLEASVSDLAVTDDDVEEQLQGLRERFGALNDVERPAAEGDFVTIDLAASDEGEQIEGGQIEGQSYQVGKGTMVEGLDEALVGLSAGESATFRSQLVGGEVAGKDVDIEVSVQAVKEQELPELDDDFAQTASEFDTVDEMRADLRERLTRAKRLEQASAARDAVLETLLGLVEIPLPEGVVAEELQGRRQQITQQLAYAGMTQEQYLENEEQTADEFEADLDKRVRDAITAQFVLDEIATKEQMGVSEAELTEHLVRRAQQANVSPDEYAKHAMEHDHISSLVSEVVRAKALAHVVERATVTDESGNEVELARLQPDGTFADEAAAAEGCRGRGARRRERGACRRSRRHAGREGLTPTPCGRGHRRGSVIRAPGAATIGRMTPAHLPVRARDGRAAPRLTDSAALAVDYADRLLVATARDVHRSAAAKVFTVTRRLGAAPVERVHDGITGALYGGVSTVARVTSRGLRALASRGVGAPTEATFTGRQVLSVVNGLVGAELDAVDDPAAITMGLRAGGRDVDVDHAALAAAYPAPTGRLVLFLHGLSESDESWLRRSDRVGSTYAERLRADTDWTPLTLRYNTGLHVSDNGTQLVALVDRLLDQWPVPVTDLAFVGHSMGGLVVRAATAQAMAGRSAWVDRVRRVVCLGTPHLGASLEKVVHLGARGLALLPTAAPFGRILDVRSPGIVDLRHGYISREEWHGQDLTSRWGGSRLAAAPLPSARYHFVAATVGPSQRHVASQLFGDWFVRFPSASGRGLRGDPVVDVAETTYLPSTDHFALLNHPRIGDWLVDWFG